MRQLLLIILLNKHKFSPAPWSTEQSIKKFSFVRVAQYTCVSKFQANFCL